MLLSQVAEVAASIERLAEQDRPARLEQSERPGGPVRPEAYAGIGESEGGRIAASPANPPIAYC